MSRVSWVECKRIIELTSRNIVSIEMDRNVMKKRNCKDIPKNFSVQISCSCDENMLKKNSLYITEVLFKSSFKKL